MNYLLKSLNAKIHLWLGLISAPIVFFVCITGTIIVFCDEIMDLSAGEARYVKEVKETRIEPQQLIQILRDKYPDRKNPSYMVTYRDQNRSVRFNCYSKNDGLHMVYMDPYTGEILKDDRTIHFFYITAHLHASLLIHGVGEWIIDIAAIIFLLELLSGLILWWPKTWSKKHTKAAFTLKWKTTAQRFNYDLHRVFGFYGLAICIVLTVTGLIIAFKPLANFTTNTFGGDASVQLTKIMANSIDSTQTPVDANVVIEKAFQKYPDKKEIQLYTFWNDKWGYYAMNAADKIGIKSAMNGEFEVYNKYTAQEASIPEALKINQKISNVFWTLHMGNYMGIWGKILTFIGGLIASMLSVTGFIIWLNKKKRSKS